MDAEAHFPADAVNLPGSVRGGAADDDPSTLARRVEHVVAVLDRHGVAACAACGARLCGHHVLFSLAGGHEDAPLCLPCLGDDLGRAPADVRAGLLAYVLSRDCLRAGWRLASVREDRAAGADATCPAAAPSVAAAAAAVGVSVSAAPPPDLAETTAPADAHAWDAGDLGCGELVLELRRRLVALGPGEVLRLRALDPGAPEDVPSWCRLTGNALVRASPPDYWIRRKD